MKKNLLQHNEFSYNILSITTLTHKNRILWQYLESAPNITFYIYTGKMYSGVSRMNSRFNLNICYWQLSSFNNIFYINLQNGEFPRRWTPYYRITNQPNKTKRQNTSYFRFKTPHTFQITFLLSIQGYHFPNIRKKN